MSGEIDLDLAASRALARMAGLLTAMKRAATMAACKEASVGEEFVLEKAAFRVERTGARDLAVTTHLSTEEYMEIVGAALEEVGSSLEKMEVLKVRQPAAEFGEDMVTGWFEAYRGVFVEVATDPLDDLLERMEDLLGARGVTLARHGTEDDLCLIFTMMVTMMAAGRDR